MKSIKLTQGKVALVCDRGLAIIERFSPWCAKRDNPNDAWYAQHSYKVGGCWTTIFMHRLIMGALPSQQVDHVNGNGLDNRISNLRIVTRSQNQQNRRKGDGRFSSQFKGVYWENERGKWHARIMLGGYRQQLGRFNNEIDAALAYDAAARSNFGEHACVNFPRCNERSALTGEIHKI